MKNISAYVAFIVAYLVKYPPKILLILLIIPMVFVSNHLPIFITEISPYIWPLMVAIKNGDIATEFGVMMLSYMLLFASALAYIGYNAFLLSVRLYNKYNIVIPT